MIKWAVYDTFSGAFHTFETEEEAREDLKEVIDDIESEAMTVETAYLLEIKQRRIVE